MSGKGKGFVWHDYLTAYNTAWKGLVELDAPSHKLKSMDEPALLVETFESPCENPEEAYMHKEAWEKLSEEAKTVAKLIFESPMEILECLMAEKYHKISKHKIKIYLIKKLGWKSKSVKRCFAELKDFASDF